MNKRGKALVFVGVLLVLLVLIILPFILSAQDDFTTICYNEKHSIIKHEITCEIQNNLQSSLNHEIDINLNLQKNKAKDVEIYEFVKKTKEVPVYETQCNPYDKETINGTLHYENCEQVQTGTKTVSYEDLEKLNTNSDSEKIKWSAGEKQFNSKEKRKVLIKWQTPIEKTNNGWGSSGNWKINPEGWWNESWNRRVNISVEETGGVSRINEIADVWANYTTGNCSKEYRVTGWNASGTVFELTSQVYNETYISGYCTSANVLFMVNLSASEHKNYTLYFNNSGAFEPSYTYLVQSHPTEINSDFPARTMLFNISLSNSLGQFNWYDGIILRNLTTTANVIGITSHITIHNMKTLKFCNLSSVIDFKGPLMVQTAKISAPCNATLRIYPYYVEWTVKNDPSVPIYISSTSWNDGEYATDRNFDYAFFGNETLYKTGAWNENGLSKNKTYIFSFENITQNGVVIVYQNVSAKFGMRWYVADGTCFRVGVDGDNCAAYTAGIPDITNTSFRLRATFNNNFSDAGWQVARDERIKMENPLTYFLGVKESYVLNTAPTHTTPLLTSTYETNFRYENLTCYNQSTQDTDNDPVTNIYNWYKNSQPLAVLNNPFETNADDYSGHGNDGTIYGATPVAGKIGGAYEFDGVNDYINTIDINEAEGINTLTVEAWVKMGGRATGVINPMIIAKYLVWNLYTNGDNNGFVFAFNDGGGWATDSVTYSTQLTTNIWYHVVGRYDGSTCKIFVNGNEVASAICNGIITTNTNTVKIGQWSNNEWFNGTIDEVRIYPYTLTPEQIAQRYQDTKDSITTNSTIVSQETNPGDTWMCQVTPNDGKIDGATLNSSELGIVWAITFNVTDSFSGIGLNSTIISCNFPDFDQGSDFINPYGPYGFAPGSWECVFVKEGYYDKIKIFTAEDDKTVNIKLSEKLSLTVEEHTQLEALYDCVINGNCVAFSLWESTNQTVTDIWKRVTKTNTAVITQENILSNMLSSTSNISVNYTILIPYKQGYSNGELLPLRMFFWFHDGVTCYSQDKGTDSNRAESPFCLPLMAETLGPNNGSVTLIVDLRPNLPNGAYNITRAIEIDPILDGVRRWTNYGQEVIGQIEVLEKGDMSIKIIKTGEEYLYYGSKGGLSITGGVIGAIKGIFNKENIIFVWLGLITLLLIYQIFFRKKNYL